jgi:nucleoside phosphorylase
MPRAVILTAHSDDYQAIRAHLADVEEETHPQGTVYELGQFSANGKTWEVAITEVTAGNSDAATETERVITYWQPNVVLSVGVAAGLKDVTAGDVVAAIEVYGYEAGQVTASGFLPRLNLGLASYVLEQRAKAEAKREHWLERIQREEQNWTPKAIVGAIAAGEKEITSSQSEIYQLLQSNYGDALAVDVTGYGVLKAIHANDGTNALIIRGITHVIEQDVTIDPAKSRIVAAQHASAFAFEILAKLEAASSLGLSPSQYTKLKQNLADASKGLLSWRRTLSNNQQIKRLELDELLNRVKTAESSTTIVLGVPGSGKSALMATLGNELIAQGYAVLAIKADQLNGAINTIEDLQRDLHLELHPSDAIHAMQAKSVLLF